jgi:hypothetical protein
VALRRLFSLFVYLWGNSGKFLSGQIPVDFLFIGSEIHFWTSDHGHSFKLLHPFNPTKERKNHHSRDVGAGKGHGRINRRQNMQGLQCESVNINLLFSPPHKALNFSLSSLQIFFDTERVENAVKDFLRNGYYLGFIDVNEDESFDINHSIKHKFGEDSR